MSKIYALIVGINDYPNVGKLNGCVPDANAVETFLQEHYAHEDLHIVKLLDADATRADIIDKFTNHLGQASEGDTALFHYSGHGSREDAPQEFWATFPEAKNETIVCYDSRSEGGYDLADKEIAVLIECVAKKNPHIVVCLDSCHSGGASRDDQAGKKRQASRDGNARDLASYIDGYYTDQLAKDGKVTVPNACHIALSACASSEVAWEGTDHRGVFTKTLLEVLETEGIGKSYGRIFEMIQIKIRQQGGKQTPQVDAYQCESIWSEWLTGEEMDNVEESYQVFFDKKSSTWQLKAGALHGIMPAQEGKKLTLNIHEDDMSAKIGQADVSKILLETSILANLPATLDQNKPYKAFISNLKNLAIALYSGLTEEENKAIIPAGHYILVDSAENADYFLERESNYINIVHRATQKIIDQEGADKLDYFKEILIKIARWENIRALQNAQTDLNPDDIELILETKEGNDEVKSAYTKYLGSKKIYVPATEGAKFEERTMPADNQLFFEIKRNENNELLPIKFKLHIKNKYHKNLYVAFLCISPLYGIYKEAQVTIPANTLSSHELYDGTLEFLEGQEKDIESNLLFKLVVSTQNANVDFVTQENFSLNIDIERKREGLAKVGGRPAQNMAFTTQDDWFTKDLHIQLSRTTNEISANKSADLGGIEILAHDSLTASVGIGNIESNTRGLKDDYSQAWRGWLPQASILSVGKGGSRNAGGQEIITLSNITGKVSVENPLKIKLNQTLEAGEFIMPFALDGDVLVPIGFSDMDNPNMVEINTLPAIDTDTKSRSLGRALKFCFYKLTAKIFGTDSNEFFQLRSVTYTKEGLPLYETDLPTIKTQVQTAHKILLLIHGIIGNTSDMVAFAETLATNKNYDLILTFDYENLNTSIESIAYELKRRLVGESLPYIDGKQIEGIGISAGKKIDILAHSMGGLVSRWFIEQLEGKDVVNRLIMCGTPNGGSNFGKIEQFRKLASWGALLGANLFAPLGIVSWAVNILKGIKTAAGSSQIVLKP